MIFFETAVLIPFYLSTIEWDYFFTSINNKPMAQKIKTNIKFQKGLDGIESRLYGFVSKINGSWRGCRDTDKCKKKIVFVDPGVAKNIIPNALYSCSLTPMHNEQGFIAVSATIVLFKARIETTVNDSTFKVSVKFGNKDIIYDPTSKDPKCNDIKGIAESLRKRNDLQDAYRVAEDFLDSACIVKGLYERSKKCS